MRLLSSYSGITHTDRIHDGQFLDLYEDTPLMLHLDIISEVIASVDQSMSGGVGRGQEVADGRQLQIWIFCYFYASADL